MEKPVRRFTIKAGFIYHTDIRLHELERRVSGSGHQIFQASRAEVVDANHLVPGREEGIHKVTSDKSGRAGDNAFHTIRN